MTVIPITVIEMEYTLDELVAAVAARLQAAGLNRQSNGQVSAFPDRRTLRYYTTIGLMDRPDTVRDRQSIYGERHVNQAVAVKRLQAAGLALAAIQARLTGLPGNDVQAIATGHPGEVPTGAAGRRRFWAEPSTPSTPATRSAISPSSSSATPGAAAAAATDARPTSAADWGGIAPPAVAGPDGIGQPTSAPEPSGIARPMLAVALSPAATLLLSTDQALTAADVTGIRDAASVLLDYLDQLRSPEQPAPPSPERNPDDLAWPTPRS